MKRLFVGLTVLLLCLNVFAGVMEVPRKVFVISTQYFDYLFSKENTATAIKLATNGDNYFEEAKSLFENQQNFKTLVVISPDSDVLSVKYTPSPYNRIVVYDGNKNQDAELFDNGLLGLFKYEVFRAVSQSVKSEFWQKAANIIGGDSLQPVALLNMPFSFLEGAVNAAIANEDAGLLSDNWNLQLLSQMKVEGIIPSIMQLSGAMDIYPGEAFIKIAGSAFCAYLQQRWGLEKFTEFWIESGRIRFLKFNKSIFYEVYGIELAQAWQDFIDEIPMPEIEEDKSQLFFDFDNDSVYKYLQNTPYGFVWYDELKKEVNIFDRFNLIKMRQLLFAASDVTALSVNSTGRYLIVSHVQSKSRENFKGNTISVYDLKNRAFIKENPYDHLLDSFFSKTLEVGVYSPVILDQKTTAALYCQNNQWYLGISTTKTQEENKSSEFPTCIPGMKDSFFQIKYDNEILKIRNLRTGAAGNLKTNENQNELALFFDFVLENQPGFTRFGAILLNEDCYPEEVFVIASDYSGGINDGIPVEKDLYFFAHKFNCDEFRVVPISELKFEAAQILEPNIAFPERKREIQPQIEFEDSKTPRLESYQLLKYNPWGLMFHGNWIPFMPVKDISIRDDVEMWPGLGVTFETQSDPLSNNKIVLSAGTLYLPMEFTKLFNPTEQAKQELQAKQMELNKDITFAAYAENTSTPVDISIGSIYKFNTSGAYSLKAIGGAQFEMPFRMNFRRMTINFKGLFTAATSYRDSMQAETFPDIDNWPDFSDSYRSLQGALALDYTNIHQYGISPLKKMGVDIGMLLTSTWDLNLIELIGKQPSNTIQGGYPAGNTSTGFETAIENQMWKWRYSPTQINAGFYSTIEIPYLLPFQNYKGWIFSLPATLSGQLFYTNGTAINASALFLLTGREIQNGFDKINLYFPRFGLYGGYDLSMEYDTSTIALPDLRDVKRFYEVCSNAILNDSLIFKFVLYATPVIGKFSVDQLVTNVTFQYYLRTQESKLNCSFELLIK